ARQEPAAVGLCLNCVEAARAQSEIGERHAGEARPREAGAEIREHRGVHEIADARAGGPGPVLPDLTGAFPPRVAEVALDVGEIKITKHAADNAICELVVEADGAKQPATRIRDVVAFEVAESDNVTNAGRGLFGTVGVGFDYQFANRIVGGVFGDFDFSNIKGHFSDPWWEGSGEIRQNWAWAAGARIGYLVNPAVLSYFGAGFTRARFSGVTLTDFGLGTSGFDTIQAQTYSGWFLSSGIEAMLPGLPGWSVKTEYRFSDYGDRDVAIFETTPPRVGGAVVNIHPRVQTVRAALAYKFGGGRDALGSAHMAYAAAPAAYNWTGFYIGAGGGYGMFNLDSSVTQNGTL